MSIAPYALSASVTRILSLSGFPPAVKTRDVIAAFSEWENVHGGFKIKWLDDTSLLVVFNDAGVAKRAYLNALLSPSPQLSSPTSDTPTIIRPYDGPDAQSIIQIVNQRSAHTSHRSRSSISGPPGQQMHHNRGASRSTVFPGGPHLSPTKAPDMVLGHQPRNVPSSRSPGKSSPPTLPTMPEHPTLDSHIESNNLTDSSSTPPLPGTASPASDSTESLTIMTAAPTTAHPASLAVPAQPAVVPSPPRIGYPGKRMLGAALGIRHPALGARIISPQHTGEGMDKLGHAMKGLSVAE